MDRQDWERLQQIHCEMEGLLEEAKNLVRLNADKFDYERAKAYWIANIDIALSGGRHAGCDMEETIRILTPNEEDEEYSSEDGTDPIESRE